MTVLECIFLQPSTPPYTKRLSSQLRNMFKGASHAALINPVKCALREGSMSSKNYRAMSKPGLFPKLLEKAEIAGMITLSRVSEEASELRLLADEITMTSFSLRKDERRDILISWPCSQKSYMPDSSPIEFPSPSIFDNIRLSENFKLGESFSNISNMFHNISVTSILALFFPFVPYQYIIFEDAYS